MSNKPINILLLLFIGLFSVPEKANAQQSVSFQVFYDELSPYGNWIDDPIYGYVWVPSLGSSFIPYGTNGYWAYTDWGWTWVSNYSWGWAPFHYGRWYNDAFYGPVWVPDYAWGPGWVNWRSSNAYYGWCPMAPGYGHGNNAYNNYWTFVDYNDFGRRDINRHYIGRSRNTTILNSTTVINNNRRDNSRNVSYNSGPDRTEVERRTGRKIDQIAIQGRDKPGQSASSKQIKMYRPEIQKQSLNGTKPRPANVTAAKDSKISPRNSGNNPAQPKQQKMTNPKQRQSTPASEPKRDKMDNRQQQRQRQSQPATEPKRQKMENPPQRRVAPQQQPAREEKREKMDNAPQQRATPAPQPQREEKQEKIENPAPRQAAPAPQPAQEEKREKMSPQQPAPAPAPRQQTPIKGRKD